MKINPLSQPKNNILFLLGIGTLGLNLFALVIMLFNSTLLQQLGRQLTPQTLVELVNGETITANPENNLSRQPETIRRFVGETLTFILTTSRSQPPSLIWEASSPLFTDDIKIKFQKKIFDEDKSFRNNQGPREKVFLIQTLSQPQQISEGKWQVEIFANQVIFNNFDHLGESKPFHQRILVKAVEKQPVSLPTNPQPWDLAAYRLGEARLKIYKICNLEDKNCF